MLAAARPPRLYPLPDRMGPLPERGHAYRGDGLVSFAIVSWPTYGELSKLPRAEMLPIANERGNRPELPGKRDPLDFVLWQPALAAQPARGSPGGAGGPGRT